jgi:hypothetical protein
VPLKNLGANERLRISGVVSLSRCNYTDLPSGAGDHEGELHSPCEALHSSSLYQYAPNLEARLYVGKNENDTAQPLTDWKGNTCSFDDHHCPVVLTAEPDPAKLPKGDLVVNLAVRAWHSGAGGNDLVEVKGECKGGDYDPPGSAVCEPTPQNDADAQQSSSHGQLTVVRLGKDIASRAQSYSKVDRRDIPVQLDGQNFSPVRITSIALHDTREGDAVEVESDFNVESDGSYPFDHFLKLAWFLTDDPKATGPKGRDAWVTPGAGKNCLPSNDGCHYPQAGATTVPKGMKGTLYLNLVADASDSGPKSAHAAARIHDNPNPHIAVKCHSVPRKPGENPCTPAS